ncbi:MAG: ClC family H(+)/Cl(-) exchange transporter [Clostridia bacterium]|nr:ClC family H(+)/Cl(-) exchange transporter [Clostridia bacterium]
MNNYKAMVNYDAKIFTLIKSILIGLLAGIVVILYRWMLTWAEEISFFLFAYIKDNSYLMIGAVPVLALVGFLIGTLVSRFSMIGGSGIHLVKGVIMGYFQNSWLATLLAKFFGGTVSILAGFSLGREGPSIQLGACVGEGVGNKLANSVTEKKVLIASGASAGLAAAFNAPLAGAVFALEEIFKYFSPIILLSTMVSAVVADFVSTMVFGFSPVFDFEVSGVIPQSGYWLLFILGVVLGAAGAFYNHVLVSVQKMYKKCMWVNTKTRPIVPAITALIFALFFPIVLGSGQRIISELYSGNGLGFLLLILVLKFAFSMISFGSGAPGGIFFPMLVMGATIGALFGNIAVSYLAFDPSLFNNFVIISMAGFFTAIVRAPITGIILLVEMSGSFASLLSLTLVSIVAYVTADLLKSVPIYDALLDNLLKESDPAAPDYPGDKKITLEVVVQHGALIDGKLVKEIDLPRNCLLIAIKRGERDIIPRGDTRILAGDTLVLMTDLSQEVATRKVLSRITTCINL